MEIVVYNPTQNQPLPPVQWNYDELKQWLTDGLSRYEGVVYDESQIAAAKADRANLNKLAQVIDAKRREVKQMYLQPAADFEAQAKELTGMVKAQSNKIDAQVKAYEGFKKQEKRQKIEAELYGPMIGDLAELVPYDRLHDPKWLNVTCSMNTISEALAKKIENISSGLSAIDKLDLDEALTEQAKAVFLKDFNLSAAINATERIMHQREALARMESAQKAQESAEAAKIPSSEFTPPEQKKPAEVIPQGESGGEKIHSVSFRIHVTAAQLKALGDFMKANGIKPERI